MQVSPPAANGSDKRRSKSHNAAYRPAAPRQDLMQRFTNFGSGVVNTTRVYSGGGGHRRHGGGSACAAGNNGCARAAQADKRESWDQHQHEDGRNSDGARGSRPLER
eukprot:6212705-Pleurochrysis_carterae.AAC.4